MIRAGIIASLFATSAAADAIGANPNDPGKVTALARGVKELDVGGIFLLSHVTTGDRGQTRVSALGGPGFQYLVSDTVSTGVQALVSYDRDSAASHATTFGAMGFTSLHVRLGLGAFLRPTFGMGALFGTRETEFAGGQVMSVTQVSGVFRIAAPFAYFTSSRIVLQAGPELVITAGSVKPDGGDKETVITVTGGFGVGAGYVF